MNSPNSPTADKAESAKAAKRKRAVVSPDNKVGLVSIFCGSRAWLLRINSASGKRLFSSENKSLDDCLAQLADWRKGVVVV